MNKVLYIILISLFSLSIISCGEDKEEDSETSSTNTENTTTDNTTTSSSSLRKIFPDKFSIDLPDSTYSNSRLSQRNIGIKNDLFKQMLTKYSEILWDEEKYLFSKDYNIFRGDLVDGKCVDKEELNESFTVEETASALRVMIRFLDEIAYPKSQGKTLAEEYQALIDQEWSYSGYMHPTIYKKINDDLYESIVMSSYDYNNDSSAQFCNQNGEKLDNVTTGDYVAWTKNDENERFAGMSAQIGRVKGVYYDKSLKFASYFYHDSSEEESIVGEKTSWSKPFQKSGAFEKCGENCVLFKSSGFRDNDTMYEMNGIIDDSLGGYSIAKIMNYGGTNYFQEEYWDSDDNLIFSKDGLCSGFNLDNASNCISNSSTDNLTNSSGVEPGSSSWSNLVSKSGKFFNLSHKLDISNFSGSDKIWLLFNTNQVSQDGRIPWYEIDGIVSSDNNSNYAITMVRYPQNSGSKTYYAYDVSNLASGPLVGSSNSYLPPSTNTQYATVVLNSQ